MKFSRTSSLLKTMFRRKSSETSSKAARGGAGGANKHITNVLTLGGEIFQTTVPSPIIIGESEDIFVPSPFTPLNRSRSGEPSSNEDVWELNTDDREYVDQVLSSEPFTESSYGDDVCSLAPMTHPISPLPGTVVYMRADLYDLMRIDRTRPAEFLSYSAYSLYSRQVSPGITCCARAADPAMAASNGARFCSTFDGCDDAFTVDLYPHHSVLSGQTRRNGPKGAITTSSEHITTLPPLVRVVTPGFIDNGDCHLFEFTQFDDTFKPSVPDARMYLFIGSTATVFETDVAVTGFESITTPRMNSLAVVHVGRYKRIVFNDMFELTTPSGSSYEVGDYEVVYETATIPSTVSLGNTSRGHGIGGGAWKTVFAGLDGAHWRSIYESGFLVAVNK